MKNAPILFLAATALAACASPLNGPTEALTVVEQHPISVEQQVVTLTIAVDRSLSDLSAMDKARLAAFADAWFTRGHGPVTITAPSGGADDFYGQQVVADIRSELNRLGMNYSDMQGATYRQTAGNDIPDVILTFTNYVASASECGAWDEEYYRRSHNLRTKNFGCSQQNNLAAMIADPRDLVAARALAQTDGARASIVHGKYVEGEVTSSQKDSNTEVQASDQ